ncbi:citrate lyase subunit alpha [Pelagibius litoralis]|uniref:Citrate lyase subunit alpha n=1 Tax=Pelagibius litoralis TaxID=374515 RepID=A0A967KBW6_9PROT|nr:citrate lyase subunit alpha [Pelagibius litoralis]
MAELPDELTGYGALWRYSDDNRQPRETLSAPEAPRPLRKKMLKDLHAAFDACEIADGATLSFHHHLRNGDAVLNAVLEIAAVRGLSGLRIAMSSLFPVHAPLVEHIRSGLVNGIWTDYAIGPVAREIVAGTLGCPAVFQTHGGRSRAIASRRLAIDVAFVAAPVADVYGGASGALGRAACGPLGYPMVDADYAHRVVVVAEEVSTERLEIADIAAERVDHVVAVDTIGDPAGIMSGATHPASDPVGRRIVSLAVRAVAASGLMVDGFSFQTGAGGVPLAATQEIGAEMRRNGAVGGFICGGITGSHVALARDVPFREILDVQCFDTDAARSYREDGWHRAISAAEYASPLHPNPVVDRLSLMLLGAAEVDRSFNVNVTLGGNGQIIGGGGGHPDTAAGAKLAVAATRLTGGGYPKIVEAVSCITTPGRDVDLLVTEAGLAVNPRRPDLAARLQDAGLPIAGIDALIEAARSQANKAPYVPEGPIAALVEYRDGSIIDCVLRASI